MRIRGPVLLAIADPLLEQELLQLPQTTLLAPGCETPADALEQAALNAPGALLLSPALAPWPGALVELVRTARTRHPGLEIAVIASLADLTDDERRALREARAHALSSDSAREHCESWLRGTTPPTTQTEPPTARMPVAPALAVFRAQQQPANVSRSPESAVKEPGTKPVLRQKVVACWGGKPGAGRSTLVVATADLLSTIPGVRVCTVDLNPVNSSLAVLLRKESAPNSWSKLDEHSLSAASLRQSLLPVQGNWSLLTGPAGHPEWSAQLSGRVLAAMLDQLKADFDYILLDLPAGRTAIGDAVLPHAQLILMTVSAFYPDVLDSASALEAAVAAGLLDRERVRLVLSPWVDSPELPAGDVAACLDLPVAVQVPLAPTVALAAARLGRPVTQLSLPEARPLVTAIAQVAKLVAETEVGRRERKGWFSR